MEEVCIGEPNVVGLPLARPLPPLHVPRERKFPLGRLPRPERGYLVGDVGARHAHGLRLLNRLHRDLHQRPANGVHKDVHHHRALLIAPVVHVHLAQLLLSHKLRRGRPLGQRHLLPPLDLADAAVRLAVNPRHKELLALVVSLDGGPLSDLVVCAEAAVDLVVQHLHHADARRILLAPVNAVSRDRHSRAELLGELGWGDIGPGGEGQCHGKRQDGRDDPRTNHQKESPRVTRVNLLGREGREAGGRRGRPGGGRQPPAGG
mmetsp:Transcript_69950/g.221627  ORF Transcript_69950/g.221627 Transcript_69950/m.221627 type:complete len:262 (+) Transcript_69950:217-1002(+)